MAVMDKPKLSKSTFSQSLPRTVSDNKVAMRCLEEGRCQLAGSETRNLTFLPSHTFCSLETVSRRPKLKHPAAQPV